MSKRRKFMIVCCIVGPMIVNLFTIAALLNGVVWLNAAFLMAKSDADAILYGTTAGILGSIVAMVLVMTARRTSVHQAQDTVRAWWDGLIVPCGGCGTHQLIGEEHTESVDANGRRFVQWGCGRNGCGRINETYQRRDGDTSHRTKIHPPADSGKRGIQPKIPLPMQPVPPRPTPPVGKLEDGRYN